MKFRLPLVAPYGWLVLLGLLMLDVGVAIIAASTLYAAGQRVTVVTTGGMECTGYAPTIVGQTFVVSHCSEAEK